MRKQFILFIISLLLAPFFFSCTQKTIKTKEKASSKRCYLTPDTTKGALNAEIRVEIPVAFADKIILDSIRASIITNLFGENYITMSNDSIVPAFIDELCREYVDNNQSMISKLGAGSTYALNNEHILTGFSLLSDKLIYAYGIERYIYMGGAHGLETRNYYNYDLKTGKLITESDIFVDNYSADLATLIKLRIVEESIGNAEKEPILKLEETVYWTDSIKPNGNFYITDESINYVFNPYEIAPYSLGETEVALPFSLLKNILKPNSVISYLVEKQAIKK